jgi:hypothetical protein
MSIFVWRFTRPELLLAARAKKQDVDLDVMTEEMLADYIQNHLLSRGAPVGSA